MIENKEVMARNIKKYMERNRITAAEICKELDIKQNTFSDWVNAKTYPRIDKIELLARKFGISKSLLVEDNENIDFITNDEKMLIEMYRKADATTSSAVVMLLKASQKNNNVDFI